MKITMNLSKETKGTFVYTCITEGAIVPTLYIKKSAFPEQPPAIIEVFIEAVSK